MAVNPTTSQSLLSTTSQGFLFPVPSHTPTSSSYALTTTVTVTATDSNLPAESTIQPIDTTTSSSGSNRSNTVSVSVMTFGVVIGLIVVGGCITLMFTQRKFSKKKIKKKRISYIEQENVLSGDDDHVDGRIMISPPLNLPPFPPQRPPTQRSPPSPPQILPPSLSQRPLPQLPPSPPESPPLLLHGSSSLIESHSLESEYDPVYTDPNHYQRSSQTTSSSGSYNAIDTPNYVIDMPTSIYKEEPP